MLRGESSGSKGEERCHLVEFVGRWKPRLWKGNGWTSLRGKGEINKRAWAGLDSWRSLPNGGDLFFGAEAKT